MSTATQIQSLPVSQLIVMQDASGAEVARTEYSTDAMAARQIPIMFRRNASAAIALVAGSKRVFREEAKDSNAVARVLAG